MSSEEKIPKCFMCGRTRKIAKKIKNLCICYECWEEEKESWCPTINIKDWESIDRT